MRKQIAIINVTNENGYEYSREYEVVAEADAGIYVDLRSKDYQPSNYLFIPNSQIISRREV